MRPRQVGGKSLSERIRAFPENVCNRDIAAALGTTHADVRVIRAKQKKPAKYRKAQNQRQNNKRREMAEHRKWLWAFAWADAHRTMGPQTCKSTVRQ